MEILCTGNVTFLSKRFFKKIGEDYKCVVYAEETSEISREKNLIVYPYENNLEEAQGIFASFNFNTVLYFSHTADGTVKTSGELEKLESSLYLAEKNGVERFIYITTNDGTDEKKKHAWKAVGRSIMMRTCQELCQAYGEGSGMQMFVLKVPYIYSVEGKECSLTAWLEAALEHSAVSFHGSADTTTDFLCDEDLGELIVRILDEPGKENYQSMNLSGENEISLEQLAELMKREVPGLKIEYKNEWDCLPVYKKDGLARSCYGWYPRHVLEEDMGELWKNLQREKKKRRISYEHRQNHKEFKERIRVILEILVTAALAEFLNRLVADNVMLKFLDFRLFGIVLMGTMNGMAAGIVTGIIACLGYAAGNLSATRWQIIFFNVQNWLPFATYLLLGAICGYTKDKHDDDLIYEKEGQDILEKKYVFLSKLYNQVLESKEGFNRQIIGYRDSFGKIYSVVKKLDSMLPDKIFYEAVNVLEEILDNDSVAIYTLQQNQDFARLSICSNRENSQLSKSINLKNYPQMVDCIKENRTFINRKYLENYPAYATPITKDERLYGMILIMKTDIHQMNMEFFNKFSIISNLISGSLIKAIEAEEKSSETIENTQILKCGRFEEILRVRKQMKEKNYVDYTLVRIAKAERSLEELSNLIGGLVRSNDILGMGEDGAVYLLLSQTGKTGMEVISDRMKKHEIDFTIVKDEV